MTVNTINSTAEFVTNGATINFPFYFKFLANDDLVVTYVNLLGASTVLTLGTHYTVSGAGNDSGSITTTSVLATGKLVVSREMDGFQPTSLRNQGKFLAETHEDVFDRLTMLIQQGFAWTRRALVRPVGKNYYDAEGRNVKYVKDPLGEQDAATSGWVQRLIGSILQTGQGPVNSAANVLFTDAGGYPGTLQQVGTSVTTLANTSDWFSRRVMDPFFQNDAGEDASQIFPGASRAVQGLVILDTPAGPKMYMTSRCAGDTSAANERVRIVEYDYAVSTGQAQPVQFTPELAIGHGEALGGRVDESGQVWLYTTQANIEPFVGENTRKGYSRIKYKGNKTTQADVASYQLMGLNGTAHGLSEYMYATVGLSTDGKRVLLSCNSSKELAGRTLLVYDREEVETSANPLNVQPTHRFRLKLGNGEGYGAVGIAADDHGIYAVCGAAALGDHGVVVHDWSGRFVRDVPIDDARGEWTYEQLMGSDGTTPNVFELEGACMYRNKLHFVCLEAWRTAGDVVSFAFNDITANFACIASNSVNVSPYYYSNWVPTNRPASGAYIPAVPYNRGETLTVYRKRVYAISPSREAGYVPVNGKYSQRSSAMQLAGFNSFNTYTYNYPGIFRVHGWNEPTRAIKRTLEFSSGALRLWDTSIAGEYNRFAAITMRYNATQRRVSMQAHGGGLETAGARTDWYAGTDTDFPNGLREWAGGSSAASRQVDGNGEHTFRNITSAASAVLNIRKVGGSGEAVKIQASATGEAYGSLAVSSSNFQVVAKSGADVCLSTAVDDTTNYQPRWRVSASDFSFRPGTDNAFSLGVAGARPSVLYAGTSTINTSDAREKTPVRAFTAEEIAAAQEMAGEQGVYQWLAMVAEKGEEGARLHPGMTVQRAIEIMSAHGLEPMRYGFICHDVWAAKPEVVDTWEDEYDNDGNLVRSAGSKLLIAAGSAVVQEATEAGDRYSFREGGLHAFIIGGLHAANLALEARLLEFETRLKALEVR